MKNIASKVQRLSQRAAELKHVIEGVPPKLTEVREAVKATAGHVQKLRADVMASVATLRAENDTQLIEALRELDAGADVLGEAGCLLKRVDMDLGPTRRVIVHLERAESVDARRLRGLIDANRERPVINAVLSAILKADELSENVELKELHFTKLTIDVGLIPAVRIGWTTNERVESNVIPPASARTAEATTPGLAQSSFFERRSVPAVAQAAVVEPAVVATPAPPEPAPVGAPAAPAASVTEPGDWRKGALERFKKMPDLTKRSG